MHIDSNDATLRRYLEDIRRTTPLSLDEEKLLLENKDNLVARQRIIDANMRFILKVAIQYRGCPIPLTDLVNEGARGLMRAIETFDPSRGLKFISYGVWWIKAFITKAINEQGNMVRIPANQHLKIRKGLNEQAMGREVSDDTLQLIHLGRKGVSIDHPLKNESKSNFAESLPDDNAIDPESTSDIQTAEDCIRNILRDLPIRERNVIIGIYGIGVATPQTLREVGESMGISHERVRQLRVQAIKRITHTVPKEKLNESLEALSKAKHFHVKK
ncbi:hypothetical protein AGMMS49938_08470 [Fibrobacterales bacterium]|nr:hypothetical protein AGMMS49938_08470 [Fibrobacterales bacterium]